MTSFEALLISKAESGQSVEWKSLTEADLMEGDVTVRVTHSTINYKDGLAITGKAPVIRRWPMIPGVDFAGTVTASTHAGFKEGDDVFLNGCGLGEMHYGGYSQYARVPGDWLLHVPEGLTRADCMAIGTAGYTSMLAVMALEHNGVKPEDGPILVTGAGGGVGSVAVALLAKLGYSVTASTGRMEIADQLKALGAREVVPRAEFTGTPRPLAKERWAGAIDVVGSATLANILSQTQYGGVVAACGLVQGIDLPATVAPFILRAVMLAGIESVMTPRAKREAAWKRLAQDLDLAKLHAMTETHPLKDVVRLAPEIVAGKVKGRVLFEVSAPQQEVTKPEQEAVVATEPQAETAKPEPVAAVEAVEAATEQPAEVPAAELEAEAAAPQPEMPDGEPAIATAESAPEIAEAGADTAPPAQAVGRDQTSIAAQALDEPQQDAVETGQVAAAEPQQLAEGEESAKRAGAGDASANTTTDKA